LCKEYTGINPIQLQNESYDSVIDLYSDMRTMQIRAKKEQDREKTGVKEIRRYASNDAGWW
jgi:hypothetical protein